MAGTYADTLEFSPEGVSNTVKLLEEIRDMMVSTKEKYLDYIDTNLVPHWVTDNGIKTVTRLRVFATEDIQQFIDYLNNRITNLADAQPHTVNIDGA